MQKRRKFKILILFIVIVMLIVNISSAMDVESLTGDTSKSGDIKNIGQKLIRIASTIGSISSVVVIVVLGIKYMLGSVEEKAEYKKTLLPFFIGAIFIFAASNIANIFYKVAENINK